MRGISRGENVGEGEKKAGSGEGEREREGEGMRKWWGRGK